MTKIKIAIVIGILLLGLILRLHHYATIPPRGSSSDEYTYSFMGLSLLTKGRPETWSNVSGYKHKYNLTIDWIYFPMVYPYFDHPPLFGVVTAGWALLHGENTYPKISLATIRQVPIFFSVISAILVFFLGLKLFNYKTAIWALLIYETTTIFVMNQRFVFSENMLTPLLLGALYLYAQTKKMNWKRASLLGLFCGLSFWTKELGIIFPIIFLYLFFIDKVKLHYSFILSGVFLLCFAAYLGYGYYYDWGVFMTIVGNQSGRNIGPETFPYMLANPISVNRKYFDGWYFLGFLSLFLSFLDFKKYKLLIVPAFFYVLLLIFSLTKNGDSGWYYIPLFPFMALATAAMLTEHIKEKNWFVFLLLLFIGLFEVQYLYEAHFGLIPVQFRVLLFLLFAPSLLVFMLQKEKAFQWVSQFWFYVLILGTIFITFTYIHPI